MSVTSAPAAEYAHRLKTGAHIRPFKRHFPENRLLFAGTDDRLSHACNKSMLFWPFYLSVFHKSHVGIGEERMRYRNGIRPMQCRI